MDRGGLKPDAEPTPTPASGPDFGGFDARLIELARAVREAGGRALFVGGQVRDRLLGRPSADVDVEVLGLAPDGLEALLGGFGKVRAVGRSFGVLRVDGLDADFSLPRRDNKTGPGHRGFAVEVDPSLDFATAARRRDFRINAMGFDPLTGELLDPWDGRADLVAGKLRVTDPAHFAEDPLRGLRAAQFAARFELEPDGELVALARGLDLEELPAERVLGEFRKLLLLGARPSIGFEFLRGAGLIRHFPEVEALIGVPQQPRWHPEGDVWIHTMMVLDRAAALRRGGGGTDGADGDGNDVGSGNDSGDGGGGSGDGGGGSGGSNYGGGDDEALMFAALCHDFGKPGTTTAELRTPGHDLAGVEPARRFLARMRAPHRLTEQVCALVRDHLAPVQFVQKGAGPKAYRRLARRLEAAGAGIGLLARVAEADHLGRTTEAARAGEFPAGEAFLACAAQALQPGLKAPAPAVQGRHLVARGLEPGPRFGRILAVCGEVQDETGWSDPERILDRALAREAEAAAGAGAADEAEAGTGGG